MRKSFFGLIERRIFMRIHVLKSKIHEAAVTEAKLEYEGSIVIDESLMTAANIREYEKVLVANLSNGNRYETYVMKGAAGSGIISVNGATARYSYVGDKITIFAFAELEENESIRPRILLVDEKNRIKKTI
jgi:aspartate 1-decarboxylase